MNNLVTKKMTNSTVFDDIFIDIVTNFEIMAGNT